MLGYTARRVLWLIPVMVGIASITFFLMHFVPGGPWDQEKKLPAQVVENLNRPYGLHDPLRKQYATFLADGLQSDLGVSYTHQDRKVTDIILQGLPATATLGGIAFVMAVGLGIPLGMAAAMKRNSVVDYFSVFIATSFASVPGFVLAILLVIVLSVRWHLLPT